MEVVWAIVGTVAASSLVGLFLLARNHPNAYQLLAVVLLLVSIVVWLCVVSWQQGYFYAARLAAELERDGQSLSILSRDPLGFWPVLVLPAVLVILWVLQFADRLKDD